MSKVIGIFCAGQAGDCLTISSILKYRNELWGDDHKIVWYISSDNMDLLKYQDIEVREFPRGYGYPEMVKVENQKLIDKGEEPVWYDFQPLVDENNHLDMERKKQYTILDDINFAGYFPAPHQVPIDKRSGVPYPLVSKKVFKIPDEWAWHPVLYFSEHERDMANYFVDRIDCKKIICLETFAGSGQSKLTDLQVIDAMDICRKELGKCNFIFTSHKWLNGNEQFPEGLINNIDVFSAAHFTVRQCALVIGKTDLLISVSSGTTVAASCWNNPPVPVLQYCGSRICGTAEISLGEFVMVTTDGKTEKAAQHEFFEELIKLLNKIK